MIRILGVHGIGNHEPELSPEQAAKAAAESWAAALRQSTGSVPFDLRVAYYADVVAGPVAQGPGADQLPPGQGELLRQWLTAMGAPDEVAQGYSTLPLRQVFAWVAKRFSLDGQFAEWFLRTLLGEVHAYFNGGAAKVGERLREAIAEQGPHVIVAHSLGSVAAFETLCDANLTADLFVTLGSPLGLLASRLALAHRRPPRVRRWINIADVGDLVAVPPKLAGQFDVDIDHELNLGLFEFHRVRRYLAAPLTGAAIGTFLA